MRIPLLDRLFGKAEAPSSGTPQGSAAGIRPVIGRDFPDPDVQAIGGRYYAYSTNSIYDGRLVNVPVQRANALTGPWAMLGDAMPRLADWVAGTSGGGPNVWAPEIAITPDGGYLLYYTAHHAAHQVQCIGVAKASRPEGPFAPVGTDPLIARTQDGDSIDPESFTDAEGTRYLIYKSGRQYSTMWLQQLTPDGLAPTGDRVELIRSDRPEEANIVEAPTLLRRGNSYILFFSANTFNSGNYFVNYAVGSELAGPYAKAPGELLNTNTIGGAYRNTGHEDVVPGPDGDYLAFHASVSATERAMFVIGLDWTPAGEPVIQPNRPAPDTTPVEA